MLLLMLIALVCLAEEGKKSVSKSVRFSLRDNKRP